MIRRTGGQAIAVRLLILAEVEAFGWEGSLCGRWRWGRSKGGWGAAA